VHLLQGEENMDSNIISPDSHYILLAWGEKGAEKVFPKSSAFTYCA